MYLLVSTCQVVQRNERSQKGMRVSASACVMMIGEVLHFAVQSKWPVLWACSKGGNCCSSAFR